MFCKLEMIPLGPSTPRVNGILGYLVSHYSYFTQDQ